MENPEFLITHHGADARLLTLAEMKRLYQETHYTNLYLKYDQPRSTNKEFPDIAYHILVASDGWEYMRDLDIEGYHASNYAVNTNGLGICISGHYDKMYLSPLMEGFYREAVADVKKKKTSLKYVNGHRAYASKSCPGKNISNAFIKEVFDGADNKALAMQYIKHAAEDLSKASKLINK